MNEFWGAIAALCVIVALMALAWWLLGQSDRRACGAGTHKPRGKMPR